MDKQPNAESEDTSVFEIGAVSEETKGMPISLFEAENLNPGPFHTPP